MDGWMDDSNAFTKTSMQCKYTHERSHTRRERERERERERASHDRTPTLFYAHSSDSRRETETRQCGSPLPFSHHRHHHPSQFPTATTSTGSPHPYHECHPLRRGARFGERVRIFIALDLSLGCSTTTSIPSSQSNPIVKVHTHVSTALNIRLKVSQWGLDQHLACKHAVQQMRADTQILASSLLPTTIANITFTHAKNTFLDYLE